MLVADECKTIVEHPPRDLIRSRHIQSVEGTIPLGSGHRGLILIPLLSSPYSNLGNLGHPLALRHTLLLPTALGRLDFHQKGNASEAEGFVSLRGVQHNSMST